MLAYVQVHIAMLVYIWVLIAISAYKLVLNSFPSIYLSSYASIIVAKTLWYKLRPCTMTPLSMLFVLSIALVFDFVVPYELLDCFPSFMKNRIGIFMGMVLIL